MAHVRMTHKDVEGVWKCPDRYVARAESNGWKKAPEADSSKSANAGDKK